MSPQANERPDFRCKECRYTAPFEDSMVIPRGSTAFIKCPVCGVEESDRDYSHRLLLEQLTLESQEGASG